MDFSDRLSHLRQLFSSGARRPVEDERLLQLYWNRAELKKELTRLQDERHRLLEQIRTHEASFARNREQQLQLEEFLGNPESGAHALVYFQLRSLWRATSAKVARFAQQLQQQQADREQRRQQLEIERERAEWDTTVMQVTDLSDDRAALEFKPPPEFPGLSIDGRRIVNTAVIAYAQQLVVTLSGGGLAVL